jgi:hypothetical protein
MPLFEVAIVNRPTRKEQEEGETEKLVFGPKAVIARDQQTAAIAAVMSGEVPPLDMSRCEVLCRPFA